MSIRCIALSVSMALTMLVQHSDSDRTFNNEQFASSEPERPNTPPRNHHYVDLPQPQSIRQGDESMRRHVP